MGATAWQRTVGYEVGREYFPAAAVAKRVSRRGVSMVMPTYGARLLWGGDTLWHKRTVGYEVGREYFPAAAVAKRASRRGVGMVMPTYGGRLPWGGHT